MACAAFDFTTIGAESGFFVSGSGFAAIRITGELPVAADGLSIAAAGAVLGAEVWVVDFARSGALVEAAGEDVDARSGVGCPEFWERAYRMESWGCYGLAEFPITQVSERCQSQDYRNCDQDLLAAARCAGFFSNAAKEGASIALTELNIGTGAASCAGLACGGFASDGLAGSDSTFVFSFAGAAVTSFAGAGAAADPAAEAESGTRILR